MTREQIMQFAGQAWGHGHEIFWFDDDGIEKFAELVAAAEREKCSEDYLADCVAAVEAARLEEREACAKVCESEGARIDASWESCAAAIRARSKNDPTTD